MRKDSISKDALEKALLIYNEHGHQIVDYDFSHPSTDYKRGTVEEPETTSKLKAAYNELSPAEVMNGERFEKLEEQSEALDRRIDEQQNKLRICRMRGNFKEVQRCMQEMKDMIKEREALDAKMAVAGPGGNMNYETQNRYERTMDQEDSYSEMQEIGTQIEALEEMLKAYMEQ